MNDNQQILLFLLLVLAICLIYNITPNSKPTSYSVKINRVSSPSPPMQILREETDDKLETKNKQSRTRPKKLPAKYKDWATHWVGRNTPIHTCYNNCTGLRKREYVQCSEYCLSQDPFLKPLFRRDLKQ